MLRATTACTFSTSELPKVVRDRQFLTLLTWKWASRHNGVHFFDISSTKSGPHLVCFVHFHFQMCFAPQRVHFFDISSAKSGPNPSVFNTCYFQTCFAHRGANYVKLCTSLERSNFFAQVSGFKMQKCASRYNGVQLFIAHLPRCLRTRRPSEPTFQPSGATKPRKNTVFRDFPTFSRTCIFFLLIFSLLTLLLLTAFSSLHIVGSLTSKLPSMITRATILES